MALAHTVHLVNIVLLRLIQEDGAKVKTLTWETLRTDLLQVHSPTQSVESNLYANSIWDRAGSGSSRPPPPSVQEEAGIGTGWTDVAITCCLTSTIKLASVFVLVSSTLVFCVLLHIFCLAYAAFYLSVLSCMSWWLWERSAVLTENSLDQITPVATGLSIQSIASRSSNGDIKLPRLTPVMTLNALSAVGCWVLMIPPFKKLTSVTAPSPW